MVSLEFFSDIILPVALCPWGGLILKQKWVPGVFHGGKGGRCVRLTTLPPSCAVVMKSDNLNFLEPSGPLQACNGTALPLPFLRYDIKKPKMRGHTVSHAHPAVTSHWTSCISDSTMWDNFVSGCTYWSDWLGPVLMGFGSRFIAESNEICPLTTVTFTQ